MRNYKVTVSVTKTYTLDVEATDKFDAKYQIENTSSDDIESVNEASSELIKINNITVEGI